jgi:hypothetical protein
MRKQDNLSALIRSLTPNESRYFRLYSSIQPGEKKYMELFEALEKNTEHTTESLCIELNIKSAQLATTKHYLYHLLLRSLRNYDENASQLHALNNSVEEAKVFTGKRMFSTALDIIESTLKKAWELEAFELLDDLLQMKYVCIHNFYQPDKMAEIMEMHKKVAVVKDELMEMMNISTMAFKFESQRNREEDFKKLLANRLMKKKPEELKSLRARIEWFGIMFRYYFLYDTSHLKCLEVVKKEASYYAKHKQIKAINPLAYLVSFTRVANIEYKRENFTASLDVSDKLAEELRNPLIEITKARRESMNTYNRLFRIHALVRLFRFEEVTKESESMLEVMKTRNDYEQYSFMFLHAVSLVHLKLSDEANHKIDELLQTKTDVRKDLQPYARMLLIMTQIDKGNIELIPHLVESAKVWMKRNQLSNPEINLFFKHISAIAKMPLNKRAGWTKLSDEIKAGNFPLTNSEVILDKWVERMLDKQKAN